MKKSLLLGLGLILIISTTIVATNFETELATSAKDSEIRRGYRRKEESRAQAKALQDQIELRDLEKSASEAQAKAINSGSSIDQTDADLKSALLEEKLADMEHKKAFFHSAGDRRFRMRSGKMIEDLNKKEQEALKKADKARARTREAEKLKNQAVATLSQ
jgi:hypothetical protein